jgi:hypothetical protein
MDVIVTASLYESIRAKFSIGQNRLVAFKAAFLGAYNDCLMDLFNENLIAEPTLLTDTSATASGTATSVIPVTGNTYYNTGDKIYYAAVNTDGSEQLLADTDFWEVTDTIDSTLEVRFLPQIKDGIRFFLQSSGEWVKGDDVDKYAGLAWERAKGAISNVLVKADQDDSTYTGPWGDTA